MMTPLVSVLGFIVRLTFFAVILVVLGLWSPLNILALCIAFVVLFTILNGIWLFNLVRRHGAPPSAGTSGTT
ncbi:MAG: hypothetical protein M1274_06100 [Actinobacteria bacterium]|nr:hypothetical protein [Actinomycetota bacterium]